MIRVAALAAVTGSGLSCPERPPSTPNLVRCYHESRFPVNEKFPFWNSCGSRRVLRRNHRVLARADREIHNSLLIHCYSLFFVAGEIAKFRNP
jgi:hypothetical protein